MPELIGQKFAQECPELITAKARDAFKLKHTKGGKLKNLADSLQMLPLNPSGKVTPITKEVQTLTGILRYVMKVSAGELNVVTHRLSCVQASAPPEAVIVAKAAMIMAYESRFRGITYSKCDVAASGGSIEGFPREQGIHAMADASWGERNIYGILIMMNNGVIVAETKKMGPVDSSAEAEGIATSKCAEILENVREIARAMGILPDDPTVIRGDNQSSVRVSNDPKAAGRLRHAQRRFATCQARVARGDVIIVHVSDANNAADFLTKWITVAKLNASIAYTSNAQAKPDYVNAPRQAPALEASMADFDPYYSETESDVVTEEGDYADAGWVTGNGPAMACSTTSTISSPTTASTGPRSRCGTHGMRRRASASRSSRRSPPTRTTTTSHEQASRLTSSYLRSSCTRHLYRASLSFHARKRRQSRAQLVGGKTTPGIIERVGCAQGTTLVGGSLCP
jgi:hypothetical protein